MSKLIEDYLNKDPVSFVHVIDLLDRNHTILYESNNGFIIRDDDVGFIYMSFNDENVMKEELSKKRYEHYISYNKEVVDFYGDNNKIIKLYQFVYPIDKMFDIEGYDVRVLSKDYANYIDSFYKAIGPGETSVDALSKGNVLGLFDNGELAGIVGRHPEGCIGMLRVFEKYRGKGYGTILEKAMINKLLKEKQRLFSEVVDGNDTSMHLQKKLGGIQGEKSLYWLV